MKKPFAFLLTAALLLALCACGSPNTPAETVAPPSGETQTPAPSQPAETPEDGADVLITGEEAQYADGLNDFGLPDLSAFTAEEIWDMYIHPENWDEAVLTMTDGTFDFDDSEPYVDPDIGADYVFDLGEWHDYDPGDWTPGPDEVGEIEIDWPEPAGTGGGSGAVPGMPGGELPEAYAFLLPDGLRDGDMAMEEDGVFMLNLQGRDADDYETIVQAAADAGYTGDAQDVNVAGMRMYTAGNGSETITVLLQNGAVMVTFE